MIIMRSFNLKHICGGQTPAMVRRRVAGPGYHRTINVTSPGGQVQQHRFVDTRSTGAGKKLAKAAAITGGVGAIGTLGTLGSLAATDAAGKTNIYNGAINKERDSHD